MVSILFKSREIGLQNVVLAIKCISNLKFLGQLQKSRIFFYNNSASMISIKDKEIIAYMKVSYTIDT